jgi:hypothetical protein
VNVEFRQPLGKGRCRGPVAGNAAARSEPQALELIGGLSTASEMQAVERRLRVRALDANRRGAFDLLTDENAFATRPRNSI